MKFLNAKSARLTSLVTPTSSPFFCHLYRLLEGADPEGVHDGVEGSVLETWEPPMGSLWDPGNGRPIIGVSPFVPFKMVF